MIINDTQWLHSQAVMGCLHGKMMFNFWQFPKTMNISNYFQILPESC